MATITNLEVYTGPLGPAIEYFGNEPMFAEGLQRPPLPTSMLIKHTSMDFDADFGETVGTFEADEAGRIVGAKVKINERHRTDEPFSAVEASFERTWLDELSFNETFVTENGTTKLKVRFENPYQGGVEMAYPDGTKVYYIVESHETENGERIWKMEDQNITRDANGKLLKVTDIYSGHGSSSFAYDDDDRLTSVVQPGRGFNHGPRVTRFNWKAPNSLEVKTAMVGPTSDQGEFMGFSEEREYDEGGLLKSIVSRRWVPSSQTSRRIIEFTYADQPAVAS